MMTKVRVLVPANETEFDTASGHKGALLKCGLRNIFHHKFNPRFRPAFAKALVEATGIPIPEDPKKKPVKVKDANGNEVLEQPLISDKEYGKMLITPDADGNTAISEVEYQTLAQKVSDALEWSIKDEPRKSDQPKGHHYSQADVLLLQVRAGQNSPENLDAKAKELTGRPLESFGETPWEAFIADDPAATTTLKETLAQMVKDAESKLDLVSRFAASDDEIEDDDA